MLTSRVLDDDLNQCYKQYFETLLGSTKKEKIASIV
jgi:hypothetical protein